MKKSLAWLTLAVFAPVLWASSGVASAQDVAPAAPAAPIYSPTPEGPDVVVQTPDPFRDRSFTAELGLGLRDGPNATSYSPYGKTSLGLDWNPWDWLELSGGLGKADGGGSQVGLMIRPRFVFFQNWGVGLGVGASSIKTSEQKAGYSNAELFLEYRISAFQVRLAFGSAKNTSSTNTPAPVCPASGGVLGGTTGGTSCSQMVPYIAPPAPTLPYANLSLGWAF
jgi:hypothetical protein